MNVPTLLFGVLLTLVGFVALVRKVHDRSFQESVALMQFGRDKSPAISAFVALLVPIVSAISGGIAFAVLGALGR
jgi:hypothetical protein